MHALRMQPPPSANVASAEAAEESVRLRVEPFTGTPAEIEQQWIEQVYRGRGDSMPQLTLSRFFPKRQSMIPSAAGAGLAWTFHWYYGLLFFIGALAAWIYERKSPKSAAILTYPVASGVIAGGSLMGVILVFWENGPDLVRRLFGG